MPDIRVEDQQGTVHVFPDGSTPEMIARTLGVKPPTAEANSIAALPNAAMQARTSLLRSSSLSRGVEGLYPGTTGDRETAERDAAHVKSAVAGVTGIPDTSSVTPDQAKKGLTAGALAGGAIVAPVATAVGLAGGAVGEVGFKKGAEAVGASPAAADMWGTTGGIIGGLAGGEAGTRLNARLANLPVSAQQIWNKITGYSKALDDAKNANQAAYLLSEQKGAQAVAEAQEKVATAKAAEPQGPTGEWAKLNQAVGTPAKAIRIGRGVSDIESAHGMPGRGLAVEGFDSASLAKMTPPEQASAIGPKWQAAGKAVSDTVQKATDTGKTLDVGDSVFKLLKKIPDPGLQEKAIDVFNDTARNIGIADQRAATPSQALQLRQALKAHARFGPMGDLGSLKGIGAQLYRAVSGDLHSAVDGLREVDMHYGDLTEAVNAVQRNVGKYMVGKWTPPQTAVEKAIEKVPELPSSSPYKPLPSQKEYNATTLKKLAGLGGAAGAGAGSVVYGYGKLRDMLNP